MQICEYFFENACYSVTKYYLCKQNNKRSLLGRKQRHQVVRSFPNRYLFSYTNKVTSLFSISCILDIILHGNLHHFILSFIRVENMRCVRMNHHNKALMVLVCIVHHRFDVYTQ